MQTAGPCARGLGAERCRFLLAPSTAAVPIIGSTYVVILEEPDVRARTAVGTYPVPDA
jgi:hypothetical protein